MATNASQRFESAESTDDQTSLSTYAEHAAERAAHDPPHDPECVLCGGSGVTDYGEQCFAGIEWEELEDGE